VQRGGNRMRVNVQLIEAESGAHLWAERFDKQVADLFDMQDERKGPKHNGAATRIKSRAALDQRGAIQAWHCSPT
jgi:hypothetical protein